MGKGYGVGGQVHAYEIPKGKTSGDVCGFLSFSGGKQYVYKFLPSWIMSHCSDFLNLYPTNLIR